MTKPAYMIFGLDIHDGDKFGQYAEGAAPLVTKYGAQILSATNRIELMDGNWTRQRVTVLKFPSKKHAKDLWTAPDYAPLKALRESASSADILLVEGMTDEEPGGDVPAGAHYVFGANDPKNTDWIPEYQAKVPPVSAKYGLKALCAGPDFEVLDGNWPRESIVLLQFPNEKAYRDFWSDPDYVPMKELREANTDGDHIAFPGGFDQV